MKRIIAMDKTCIPVILWILAFSLRICHSERPFNLPMNTSYHIMLNRDFWEAFHYEVEYKKSWKCAFPRDILLKSLKEDSTLYTDDDYNFTGRRQAAELWVHNDALWAKTLLGACKELALRKPGCYSQELMKYRMLEPLEDFVEHINYFYQVASSMEMRGEKINVSAQGESFIHDIDKLDPVMLVAYSEKFADNKNTTLWNQCVDRHVHINPHHQQHCLWHDCCQLNEIETCTEVGENALREMVCDKVSRRLQKNLNGQASNDMWDVDIAFFGGLPQPWLNKAVDLMQLVKNWKSNNTMMQFGSRH